MTNHGDLEQKRQTALKQLRERRKEPRRELEVQGDRPEISRLVKVKEGPETKIDLLRRYLEVKNSRPKPDKSGQVNEVFENPFYQPEPEAQNLPDQDVADSESSQDKRTPSQVLLEQLGGSAFLKHMHTWLYSADTTFHPSSSTLDEIEQYRKEVRYRYNVLKEALTVTQKELEAIEVHVRAVKAVQADETSDAPSDSEPASEAG